MNPEDNLGLAGAGGVADLAKESLEVLGNLSYLRGLLTGLLGQAPGPNGQVCLSQALGKLKSVEDFVVEAGKKALKGYEVGVDPAGGKDRSVHAAAEQRPPIKAGDRVLFHGRTFTVSGFSANPFASNGPRVLKFVEMLHTRAVPYENTVELVEGEWSDYKDG